MAYLMQRKRENGRDLVGPFITYRTSTEVAAFAQANPNWFVIMEFEE